MAASMDVRGSRNSLTMKLTKSIYEARFLAVGSKTGSAYHDAHMQRARWERTPARGPLWLLPSGPDQVRGVTPPAPVERANRLILANPFPRDEAAQTAHQKRERSRADSLFSYIYVGSDIYGRVGTVTTLIDLPRPRTRLFGPLPVAHPSEPRDRRDGGHLRSKGLRIERTERELHGSRRRREVSESLTSGT